VSIQPFSQPKEQMKLVCSNGWARNSWHFNIPVSGSLCSQNIHFDGIDNYITRCYRRKMQKLMTKHFAKWAKKQNIPNIDLAKAMNEVEVGNFEANLGGHVIKKRIRFQGIGKSGSGRTIICYKQADRAFFVHGCKERKIKSHIQRTSRL